MSDPVTDSHDSESPDSNAHDPEFDGPPTGPAGAESGDAPVPGMPEGIRSDGRIDLDESRGEGGDGSTDGPEIQVPAP
jgi:hypothetical protein